MAVLSCWHTVCSFLEKRFYTDHAPPRWDHLQSIAQQTFALIHSKKDEPTLSELQVKVAHNSFDKGPLHKQMQTSGPPWEGSCRGVEFDLVLDPTSCTGQENWCFSLQHGGRFSPDSRSFEDALKELQSWSLQNPTHDVCFLHLDLKETCVEGDHKAFAREIDRQVKQYFHRNQLLTPQDIRGSHKNLATALKKEGWPSLKSLKGKFIVVMTGNDTDPNVEKRKSFYRAYNPKEQIAFVDIDQRKVSDIEKIRKHHADRAFLNVKVGYSNWKELGQQAQKEGLITRAWKVNSPSSWSCSIDAKIHLFATDEIFGKPWACFSG